MSHEEFRRRVYEKGSYLPEESLNAAIEHHEHIGQTENGHVSVCVVLAGSLRSYFAKDPKKKDEPVFAGFDSAASLTSSRLRDLIAPDVEQVRQDVWGPVTAPFSTWKAASEWLDSFGARGERSAEDNARAHQLYTDWIQDRRKTEIEGIMGVEVYVEMRAHAVPYVAHDTDHVTHAVVPHGSQFVALGSVAKRLADRSGFNEAAIVRHILCEDLPLILPSIRITKALKFGVGGGSVHVEFNSPDVTHRQIAKVLKRVREFWGKSSKGRLGDDDVRFLEIIAKRGGVPNAGTVQFFKDILQDCLDEGLGSYEKSAWRGPYMWHRRLMKREKNLGTKEN